MRPSGVSVAVWRGFWIASFLAMTCKHVYIVYIMGMPTLHRVGRGGRADMAEVVRQAHQPCPPSAAGR